jgi:galactokinase
VITKGNTTMHALDLSPQSQPSHAGHDGLLPGNTSFSAFLRHLYGSGAEAARERYAAIAGQYLQHFGREPSHFISAPGRVEIGGNHTDHNHGCVIAASVNLDAVAAAGPTDDGVITIVSEGYARAVTVRCDDLTKQKGECGTTQALVRGIAARFREKGYRTGGCRAYISSQVAPGSGLSSSAAIEVLIGAVLNALYNEEKIPPEEIAAIGQYAENEYFGKPCGLMDQVASAVGGIVTIDFGDPARPLIQRLRRSFTEFGLQVLVVHTGGSHADLTPEYAAVPAEMKAVAHALGGSVCRDIANEDVLLRAIPALRKSLGDRAILRTIHFLRETARVGEQVRSLEAGNITEFLTHVSASGRSSALWLQNCYAGSMPAEQGIMLALALTEAYPGVRQRGACRVHGGGFAGTMLALLPEDLVAGYRERMEFVFGPGSVAVLTVRATGAAVHERRSEP